MKKKIAILGSTGSIGKTLIKILEKDKKNIQINLLSANKNYKELFIQAKKFKVKNLIITDKKTFLKIKKNIKNDKIKIFNDFSCFKKIFKKDKIDYAMSAISGLDGLRPTLNIIEFTKTLALANKESIICGWSLIKKKIKKFNTVFIPVDSEHFSIMSLIEKNSDDIEKIFITASGGPFNKLSLNKFKLITPKLALKHPNWKMGKKITIDSATMMNKVFEVIEAKKIFNIDYKKLIILVHPKSYVHALVKFSNGLTKILIHDTNMSIPIFNSLYINTKKKIQSNELNLNKLNNLEFKNVDYKKFPIARILKLLPKKDTLFETVIVSTNDKLVDMFLNNKIKFTDIYKILFKVLNMKEFKKFKRINPKNIAQIERLCKYVSFKIDTLSI